MALPLAAVHAILVGHSHYDHLMDVPLIARRYVPNATIYGSLTTKRILMGDSSMRANANRIDSLVPADSTIVPYDARRDASARSKPSRIASRVTDAGTYTELAHNPTIETRRYSELRIVRRAYRDATISRPG